MSYHTTWPGYSGGPPASQGHSGEPVRGEGGGGGGGGGGVEEWKSGRVEG